MPKKTEFEKVEIRNVFARNIISFRNKKGMSQEQMSIFLNTTRATIGAYEERRAFPTVEKLLEISEILKREMKELIVNQIQW